MENLPKPFVDVMITYNKKFAINEYNTQFESRIITKRGFYSDTCDYFAIPPEYRHFNGVLLPHGFGGDRITADKVTKWKYCE